MIITTLLLVFPRWDSAGFIYNKVSADPLTVNRARLPPAQLKLDLRTVTLDSSC